MAGVFILLYVFVQLAVERRKCDNDLFVAFGGPP